MSDATGTGGLQVDPALRDFVADELVAGLEMSPARFWAIVADLNQRLAVELAELVPCLSSRAPPPWPSAASAGVAGSASRSS